MIDSAKQHGETNVRSDFICGVIEGFYGKPWTFEQRKDLFKRMKKLNLNAFMYAPKDDTKHRANWRQLYTGQEVEELRSLIKEANDNGIDFYYSLAPGLDMIYSQQSDIDVLIKKYNQLVGLGCKSFAILFDDIEPNLINEKDKKVFDNYAKAQVSIANMIYDHLKRPNFLFCPTEYCESRAVPNVPNSIYLITIGGELSQGIDFLWSGSRVISRLITEESIEMLTKVIKRKPIIWENLHANDYDKKRVFLGPYSGRSTSIIPKIKGVMTNPNCEYEANYIAIHTLAQWSRCKKDINSHNRCNQEQYYLTIDNNNLDKNHFIINEQYSFNPSMTPNTQDPLQNNDSFVYNPHQALINAIKDWLPHLRETKSLADGDVSSNKQRNDDMANNQLLNQQHLVDTNNVIDFEESNVEMVLDESQQFANSMSTNKIEMDTSSSSDQNVLNENLILDGNTCDSCDMTDVTENSAQQQQATSSSSSSIQAKQVMVEEKVSELSKISTKIEDDSNNDKQQTKFRAINFQNLSLLIDLFYLPFEHGLYGSLLINDIKWLKDNSDIVFNFKEQSSPFDSQNKQDDHLIENNKEVQMKDANEPELNDGKTLECWDERAKKLNELCAYIGGLVNNLIYDCPNKLLIIELYPYLADVRDVTNLIIDYVKFLRHRTSQIERFYYCNNSKQKDNICNDEQEPWVHRGGFIGDVQRLISG